MPVDPPPVEEVPVESPLFPGVVAADRLELRGLSPDTVDPFEFYEHTGPDAPAIEEVTEFLPWDPNPTVKAALDHLKRAAEGFRECERCDYLVVPRSDEPDPGGRGTGGADAENAAADERGTDDRSGRPDPGWAGACTLEFDWDRRGAEFGVWLRKPYWGRGYAAEAGGALLALAFERLDLEVVWIEHEVGNRASRAMIEKLVDRYGGRHEGLLRNGKAGTDGPRDMHRFSTGAGEYREATGGDRAADPHGDPLVIDR